KPLCISHGFRCFMRLVPRHLKTGMTCNVGLWGTAWTRRIFFNTSLLEGMNNKSKVIKRMTYGLSLSNISF
ncbi:MAG: hypothetical protein KAH38_08905, partial [Candidatus Hydrogenedentes bacterium]|nr:hypothetical protein [Candidatus Hydrogenedentota bacterium]